MYKYETHLHTFPISGCASASVRESVEYYKELGYDAIFLTNHFPGCYPESKTPPTYEELMNNYFSAYEEALEIGKEIGIKVFCGIEISYEGIDFLVYGLDKAWYLAHPEIMDMKIKDKLLFFRDNGALVVHAHPFRYDPWIEYIRLFPGQVHGVEVINTSRTDDVNVMARKYADHYGLILFAGSDNHVASGLKRLAGVCCERRIADEADFIKAVLGGETQIFCDQY